MAEQTTAEQTANAAADLRRKRFRQRLTQILAVAVILAVFGFIFPRIASYSSTWNVVRSMTGAWIATVLGVTLLNLVTGWWFISTCLPGLKLRRAAAMNLSSTAVANTVPGGGAIALGVSWNMASAWGISGETFTLYTLVSGLWSQFAKFGTPAVALIALVTVGGANRTLVLATVLGTAVFLAAFGAVIAALYDERFMAALGRLAQRVLNRVLGWFHRTGPQNVEQGFLDFRHQAAALIRTRGWLISISTLASDLTGWIVQLTCLRACGVTTAEVSWEKSFAGYALIRLLTTIPITPGGLGITEVGLTAYLASGLGTAVTDRIAAAILLARALTFIIPIPLGAVNFTVWKWLRRNVDVVPVPEPPDIVPADADAGVDSGGEVDADARADSTVDPGDHVDADTRAESPTDTGPATGAEPDADAEPGSNNGPATYAEPGADVVPGPGIGPAAGAEPDADVVPGAGAMPSPLKSPDAAD